MAGTLTVQNIEGPSSGANANKVIIPSGHTLDVSGGTFTPSEGQVVKTTRYTTTTYVNVASQSYTSVWSGSHTPVLSSSTLIFNYFLTMRSTNQGNAEGRYYIKLNLDGSEAQAFSSLGNYDYGGSGIWTKDTIASTVSFNNTDGGAVSFDFQVKNTDSHANAQTSLSEGSNTSSIIVTEIAG